MSPRMFDTLPALVPTMIISILCKNWIERYICVICHTVSNIYALERVKAILTLACFNWEVREAEEAEIRVKKSKKITINNFFLSSIRAQADGRSGDSVRTILGIDELMTCALFRSASKR